MALLYLDGVDHYSSNADMDKKWSVRSNGGTSASQHRTGTQSYDYSSSDGPRMLFPSAQAHATFIVGFALYTPDYLTTGFAGWLVFAGDGGATSHLVLHINSMGVMRVLRSSTVLGTTDPVLTYTSWHYIEMKATLHDSTGAVELRVDGTTVLSLSGIDTKNAGTGSVFDCIRFNETGFANNSFSDDFYICNGDATSPNDFLGDIAVETIYPSGAGNTTGLTPSTGANYAAVDEALWSTTDYVSSSVATTKDTYAFGNVSTPRSIVAVQGNYYAQKTDGSRLLVPVVRHSGTDYDSTGIPLPQSFTDLRQIWVTNPGTGSAWTDTDLNAAEFGVKVG